MIWQILAACFILAYFATPATADTIIFGWENNGTLEFTDDVSRVPVAFHHKVRRIEVDGLEDYAKFTKEEDADEE
jgi:hypothetical protein